MDESWKIAIAVREDLETWQKLNIAAFLSSGIASECPGVLGDEYVDASMVVYTAMFALPVRVYAGDQAGLRRAFDRGLERGLAVSVYTDELFTTMNDVDNRAAVARVSTNELCIAGFAVAGVAKQVDKALDKLRPHS